MKLWHIRRQVNGFTTTPESFHSGDDALDTWALYVRDLRYMAERNDDGTPVLVVHLSRDTARYWLDAPTEAQLSDEAEAVKQRMQQYALDESLAAKVAAEWYVHQCGKLALWQATCLVQAQIERQAVAA